MKDALSEMAAGAGIETRNTKSAAGIVDEPSFEADQLGRFIFTWRDDGVRVIVSNLERRAREFTCYLEALYRSPQAINGTKPTRLLSRTRVNLESMTGREGLTRALNRSMDRAWAVRIEQVHSLASDHYQSGDPIAWLAETPEPGKLEYLAHPFIERGQHTIWFADGGSGKSLLALALGINIADGTELLPGVVVSPCPVLYLDWETDRDTHRRRHAALTRGVKIANPKALAYKRMVCPITDAVEELSDIVRTYHTQLLICDSVAMASGGDTMDSEDAVAYFRAIRSLNVTALSIAHVPKGKPEGDRPFGSTYWHNLARSTWELTAAQEEGQDELFVMMQHRKSNNGRLQSARSYLLQFADDTILVSPADPSRKSQLEKKLPLTVRIKNVLLDDPLKTAQEIATILDVSAENVSNRLRDNDGRLFTRRGDGKPYRWAVLAQEEQLTR